MYQPEAVKLPLHDQSTQDLLRLHGQNNPPSGFGAPNPNGAHPFVLQNGLGQNPTQRGEHIQGQFCYLTVPTEGGDQQVPGVFIPIQYIMPLPAEGKMVTSEVNRSDLQNPQRSVNFPSNFNKLPSDLVEHGKGARARFENENHRNSAFRKPDKFHSEHLQNYENLDYSKNLQKLEKADSMIRQKDVIELSDSSSNKISN